MKQGIKETQEMLVAVLKVAEVLGPILSDGFQAGADLSAVFAKFSSDDTLKAKVAAAADKANLVPSELKDLDLAEGLQLLTVALPEIMAVIAAWKKIELPAPPAAA